MPLLAVALVHPQRSSGWRGRRERGKGEGAGRKGGREGKEGRKEEEEEKGGGGEGAVSNLVVTPTLDKSSGTYLCVHLELIFQHL